MNSQRALVAIQSTTTVCEGLATSKSGAATFNNCGQLTGSMDIHIKNAVTNTRTSGVTGGDLFINSGIDHYIKYSLLVGH